jgi:hypothetical protein
MARSAALAVALWVGGCDGTSAPPPSWGDSAPAPEVASDRTDEFLVLGGAVDVLLVVDPEAAAPGLAQEVADALPLLLDQLLGGGALDHLGVVSTALGEGTGGAPVGRIRWVDARSPEPLELLDDLDAGAGPFGGLEAVRVALDDEANAGFFQPGAPLHVVVVAGADDDSPDPAQVYLAWLDGLDLDPRALSATSRRRTSSAGSACAIRQRWQRPSKTWAAPPPGCPATSRCRRSPWPARST